METVLNQRPDPVKDRRISKDPLRESMLTIIDKRTNIQLTKINIIVDEKTASRAINIPTVKHLVSCTFAVVGGSIVIVYV